MAMALSLDKKVFHETQGAIVRGEYSRPDGPRKFLGSRGMQEDVDYYEAAEVEELVAHADEMLADKLGDACVITVREADSLVAAFDVQAERADADGESAKPVLVLNFANPFSAGGNTLIGKNTQEGELCRRSTVFASISADEAHPYFDANSDLGGSTYTNGVLVSPYVEVFRELGYLTLETPYVVAVISAPAPYSKAVEDKANAELFGILKARIQGILAIAAREGYKHLMLGAWGCGSNCNDPAVVARAFREALNTPLASGTYANLFTTATFAITDDVGNQPNLTAFQAEFAS